MGCSAVAMGPAVRSSVISERSWGLARMVVSGENRPAPGLVSGSQAAASMAAAASRVGTSAWRDSAPQAWMTATTRS